MGLNLSHLNPQQQKAVKSTKGRILILAGAGSGKTSVIIHRIAYLIKVSGISPDNILGMTFTNKAAEEMRFRLSKMIGAKNAKKVTLCTFHSFCMQVLRAEIHRLGYTKGFSLYDEKDIKRLMKQIALQLPEHKEQLSSIESSYALVQEAKNQSKPTSDPFTKKLLSHLEISLRAYNAVDFDSLISLTVKLFEEFPEVLRIYQNRFHYLMIDEYQDTNPMQYRIADLLSKKHNNLCVVGDDDQSIYGWRGAEIKHILNFESTEVIKLEQNYRSTVNILQGANHVIKNNSNRHEKQLWSDKGAGPPIYVFHAPSEAEEAQAVIDRLVFLKKEKGLNWKDIAILYRSNLLSRPFEVTLMQTIWEKEGKWIRGIPYQIFGGTELYARSEIKDIIAYLRAIVNPQDGDALLRIINFPRRGISANTLDMLTKENRQMQRPLWEVLKGIASEDPFFSHIKQKMTNAGVKGVTLFVDLLETAKKKFSTPPLHSTLRWFLDEIAFKDSLKEEVKSEKMQSFKWENAQQCIQLLANYEEEMQSDETEKPSLHHFLMTTLLDQNRVIERTQAAREDKVSLMTIHSAKGLEFPACFLVCLEDHIIPHEKSLMETGLEEERRLMYVAMTRAKQYLTLSMSRERKKYGKEMKTNPSRFLFEIPKEQIQVNSWKTANYTIYQK